MLHLMQLCKRAETKAAAYAQTMEQFFDAFDRAFNAGDGAAIAQLLAQLEALTPLHIELGGSAATITRIIDSIKAFEAFLAQSAAPPPAAAPVQTPAPAAA